MQIPPNAANAISAIPHTAATSGRSTQSLHDANSSLLANKKLQPLDGIPDEISAGAEIGERNPDGRKPADHFEKSETQASNSSNQSSEVSISTESRFDAAPGQNAQMTDHGRSIKKHDSAASAPNQSPLGIGISLDYQI